MSEIESAAPAPGAATDTSAPTPAPTPTNAAPAAAPPPPPPGPIRKPIEQWQIDKGVHGWLIAFACMQNRWPQGRELTEAEFDAAIQAAFDIAFR